MFLIFSFVCLFGSSLLLLLYHPVHTVLVLIVVACGISGILLKSGAEFLGLLLVVVYIGAVVVLFLFCVFMISTRTSSKQGLPLYEGISFIGAALLLHLVIYLFCSFNGLTSNWAELTLATQNLENFNTSLFTGSYNFSVIAAGFLLLVSMVGAIFLTIQDYKSPHSVSPGVQISRLSNTYKKNLF